MIRLKDWREQGFLIFKGYSAATMVLLKRYAEDWACKLVGGQREDLPIYHRVAPADHEHRLQASHRHTLPDDGLAGLLLRPRVSPVLHQIVSGGFEMVDDGWGWLGMRLIRPNMGDGYPLSCKAWGPDPDAVSCHIPIIGHEPGQTLTLVPGSHLREYPKYLPEETKFRKDEWRFAGDPSELNTYSPGLLRGHVILFHPRLLHSVEVTGERTSLSLEFRVRLFEGVGGEGPLCYACQQRIVDVGQVAYTLEDVRRKLGYKSEESVKRACRRGDIPGRINLGLRLYRFQRGPIDRLVSGEGEKK